jgi:pyridoxal phosphate enzyme (YggS family)
LRLGITTFGENRVQEAEAKRREVDAGTWHLIGRLQSNKVARAVATFDVVESVDSVDLAQKLGRAAQSQLADGRMPVYLQVNVDRDPAKGGFDPDALEADFARLTELPGIQVVGLMTVGRLAQRAEDARSTFRALRDLRDRLATRHSKVPLGLSMGMSDDFEVAVEEGATIVRVGRALFGERDTAAAPDHRL